MIKIKKDENENSAKLNVNKGKNVTTKGKNVTTKGINVKENCQTRCDKDEVTTDHHIQLNLKNMVNGKLVNKQGVLCLIDSGASVSVISQGIINKSRYLQALGKTKCKPIKIVVAGGNILNADAKICFNILIQNHIFEVKAYVLPMLGGLDYHQSKQTYR